MKTYWDRLRRSRTVRDVLALSDRWVAQSEFELRCESERVRERLRIGAFHRDDLVRGLALVRESARRAHGTAHFGTQVLGGLAMSQPAAIEMETGEGKTLTALLLTYVWGLSGQGCHVLTANDFLAKRDAEHARPVLERLGLSVGVIVSESTPADRRRAYGCDVTFTTVTQIGFDYLRDRLAGNDVRSRADVVQRPLASAIVDEADSVLLDEARTPLQIASRIDLSPREVAWRSWARDVAGKLVLNEHFLAPSDGQRIALTEAGCRQVLVGRLPTGGDVPPCEQLYQYVERALAARLLYRRDHDYLIRDSRVVIVSPTTGRSLEGRQWQDGLQQAIETEERLPLSPQTQPLASITVQSLMRKYQRLTGMSGTLIDDARELREVYRLVAERIPTRTPCRRQRWPVRCFLDLDAKLRAIVVEVQRLSASGRPILVGTPSIETSDRLSAALAVAGIAHELLTAREPDREAGIVATAGQGGRVTIATNMAGRGTDIRLDERARNAGGLHVLIAGWQPARRCVRQLAGRASRQGDPGSYQEFLSFDDELAREADEGAIRRARRAAGRGRNGEISSRWSRWHRAVQARVEREAREQRQALDRRRRQIDEWAEKMAIDPTTEWGDEVVAAA